MGGFMYFGLENKVWKGSFLQSPTCPVRIISVSMIPVILCLVGLESPILGFTRRRGECREMLSLLVLCASTSLR